MMEQSDDVKAMLKVNSKASKGKVRLFSDVLEPQQSSQNYATFNIRREGILSTDSRLVLPLYASNATTRLTAYGGAFAVIKNATLRTSTGVTICQTNDCHYLASMRNHFVAQEGRKKVGRFKNGTFNIFEYTEEGAATYTGKYGLLDSKRADVHARYRLGTTANDRVEYVIALKDLFPEFMPISLPLFAIEGNVQLFLEFSDNGKTGERAVSSDANNNNIGDVTIDLPNLKFISDHIHFEQSVMDRLMTVTRSQRGLVIPYADYNEVVFTRIAPAAPAANEKTETSYQTSIGLSGARVKHIMIHNQEVGAGDEPAGAQKIAGKFASQDSWAGVGGQKVQIQINNENYYTQDLETQEFFRELEDVYGVAPSIPLPAYTLIGAVTDGTKGDGTAKYTLSNRKLFTADNFFAHTQADLLGSANIIGMNFCNPLARSNTGFNGVQVGNSPVLLTYRRSYTDGHAQNLKTRVFVCCERLMSIQNGKVMVNFS